MFISLNPIKYFDLAGVPLSAGRLKIHLHGSDNLADTYVMSGSEFIAGPNPVVLDASGEQANTIFLEATIYDIEVEKLVDGNYAKISDFQFGFTVQSAMNDTVVYGIENLRNSNTELGIVNVVGYDDTCYCGPRMYIWDDTCTDEPDGGCIVESNTSADGRWLLLSDLREMPNTYYGVTPGHEENLSAFLTYQEVVGQWGIRMPPIPRFLEGTYTTSGRLSTTKTLSFDSGAKFSQAQIGCAAIEVTEPRTDYIADFDFTAQQEAHSSWFRTLSLFISCVADTLVMDSVNYFTDTAIRSRYEIEKKTLVYPGNTRLPVTYLNNGVLVLNNCNIVGSGVFNGSDVLSFANTVFKDDWFSIPGNLIDFVNKVTVRSSALNTLQLSNFKNVYAYVNAITVNGETVIDLAGRKAGALDLSPFSEIRNVQCDTLTSHRGSLADTVFYNVKCDNVYASCRYLTVKQSDINFGAEPTLTSLTATDSRVGSGVQWTSGIAIDAQNCWFGIPLNYVSDNTSNHASVSFKDCRFTYNAGLTLKHLSMYRCVTNNNTIKIYPYLDNGSYVLQLYLEDCTINNNHPVEFTKIDTIEQDNVYDCILDWHISGNTFSGNTEGLRCRYWQTRNGYYSDRTFVKMDPTVHTIVYSGNNGQCPAESMKGLVINDNKAYTEETLGDNTLYKYTRVKRRVMPGLTTSYWWYQTTIANDENLIKYYGWVESPYDSLTYSLFIQTAWYPYFTAHDEYLNNGDLFEMAVLLFGDYLRIVQSGSGDHNDGIQGRIV